MELVEIRGRAQNVRGHVGDGGAGHVVIPKRDGQLIPRVSAFNGEKGVGSRLGVHGLAFEGGLEPLSAQISGG